MRPATRTWLAADCAPLRAYIGLQVSVAVPVTFCDVLLTPLFTVRFRSAGAVAVMVACPGETQVALPLVLTVATPVAELDQLSPSATVSSRVLLLVKVAVAVNCTSVGGLTVEVAVC